MDTRRVHRLARRMIMTAAASCLLATDPSSLALARNLGCAHVFDFSCARTDALPTAVAEHLGQHGLQVLSDHPVAVGVRHWSDRAVPVDLLGDLEPELLVPVECGATGNCSWYIYAMDPPRSLGTIDGLLICVERRGAAPERVTAYSSVGAGHGLLVTQVFKNGQYRLKSSAHLEGPRNDRVLASIGPPECNESDDAP